MGPCLAENLIDAIVGDGGSWWHVEVSPDEASLLMVKLDCAGKRLDAKHKPNLSKTECPRMELHDLGEVIQEIGQAVVAGVWMIFVLYLFFLQLFVERGCTFFESVVVILTAVEIYTHTPQGGLVSVR
jgi:hypothetical protein